MLRAGAGADGESVEEKRPELRQGGRVPREGVRVAAELPGRGPDLREKIVSRRVKKINTGRKATSRHMFLKGRWIWFFLRGCRGGGPGGGAVRCASHVSALVLGHDPVRAWPPQHVVEQPLLRAEAVVEAGARGATRGSRK